MVTFETFTPVVGVTVNVIGTPAFADVGSATKLDSARALTVTVTSLLWTVPAVAIIFAVPVVVSVAVATPVESVVVDAGEIVPRSVLNVTGTPLSMLPPSSVTTAVT